MKKIIIAASLLAVALTSNAQDTYKFAAGDNNLELGAAPFSGSPLTLPYLKYRRFLSETSAFRVGFSIGGKSTSSSTVEGNKTVGADPTSKIDINKKESSMAWLIAPGYEKHFAGTERLSPYIGAELPITGSSSTIKQEVQATDGKINTTTTKNDKKGGSIAFGLNLIAGADYYFAKRVYIGAEMGWGLTYTKFSDKTVDDTSLTKQADDVKQGSEIGYGSTLGGLNGKFKLGFLF